MMALYIVIAVVTLAVPAAVILGQRGYGFDLRGRPRRRGAERLGGRREGDPQPV